MTISFKCEDLSCERKGLTSSCVIDRQHLLVEAMFSKKNESVADECWPAFECIMYIYKFLINMLSPIKLCYLLKK